MLQDYAQNERQTLQLLATNLTAKVRETLAAQHPDVNCRRVVEAITRRCDYEVTRHNLRLKLLLLRSNRLME